MALILKIFVYAYMYLCAREHYLTKVIQYGLILGRSNLGQLCHGLDLL